MGVIPSSRSSALIDSTLRGVQEEQSTYIANINKTPRSIKHSLSDARITSNLNGLTRDLIIDEPNKSTYFRGFEKEPSQRIKKLLWIESRSDYSENSK